MSRGYLIFNNIDTRSYGVYINGMETYNAPARDFEEIIVPGRDGALIFDNQRYESIEHSYAAFIIRNMKTNLEGFRNQIIKVNGYAELTDSYHPDEYYRARYMSGLDSEINDIHTTARFTLAFMRDPRRFLASGKQTTTLTSGGTINNPTLYASKPLIRVYGTGILGVGESSVTITSANVYTDLDCEMQDAFKGTTNCNANVEVTGDQFPVLQPGNNGITLGTGITQVEITPRWWRI